MFHCWEIRIRAFKHKLARLSEDFLLVLTSIAAIPLSGYWNSTSKAGIAAEFNVLGQMLIAYTVCNVLCLVSKVVKLRQVRDGKVDGFKVRKMKPTAAFLRLESKSPQIPGDHVLSGSGTLSSISEMSTGWCFWRSWLLSLAIP